MNIFFNGEHPSEEQLMELAVSDAAPGIKEHTDNCPLCTKTVKEFREVRKLVASLQDEEVPLQTEQRILNIMHHNHHEGIFSGLQALFANPFLIALVIAIVVILLYFLVGSEVFKGP
jgi:hypothetical protein